MTGKFAFFKAIVTGDPKPTVTWCRNNGDVSDTSRYQVKYDPNSNEHTFEVRAGEGLSSNINIMHQYAGLMKQNKKK